MRKVKIILKEKKEAFGNCPSQLRREGREKE